MVATLVTIPNSLGAGELLHHYGTEAQKKALLPGIAAGDITATFAFSEDSGLNDAASVAMTATSSGG